MSAWTDRIFVITAHPLGGFTFVSKGSQAERWPYRLKYKAQHQRMEHVARWLLSRSVPWWNIVWPVKSPS